MHHPEGSTNWTWTKTILHIVRTVFCLKDQRIGYVFCFKGFIDEAGETTEPETLVPIGLGASQIILAGDPKQVST